VERYFSRSIDSLDGIFQFVTEFLASEGLAESNSFNLNLIFEELFTNMVKYSTESNHEVRVAIDKREDQLVLSLTDFDVEPFDPTQAPEVDVDEPLSTRTPGGLGIHFVRKMTDSISYEYADRNSKITLIKRVEE
jgi:anti-sigma regulatory factor (Ser/Thr protein kinase)